MFLIGGVDQNRFIPSGTLMFGARMPSGFEFGVGPSVTLGGYRGAESNIAFAAGQTFRIGGIRIPFNVAYVPSRYGDYRVTLVTGWAIRNHSSMPAEAAPPPRTRTSL